MGFPRLNRRGPIEASEARRPGNGLSVFPRLNRRGPIEAYNSAAARARGVPDFRALTGAAPLKHVEIIAGKALKHHFRALTGAAPLKLALFAIWALYSVISAP